VAAPGRSARLSALRPLGLHATISASLLPSLSRREPRRPPRQARPRCKGRQYGRVEGLSPSRCRSSVQPGRPILPRNRLPRRRLPSFHRCHGGRPPAWRFLGRCASASRSNVQPVATLNYTLCPPTPGGAGRPGQPTAREPKPHTVGTRHTLTLWRSIWRFRGFRSKTSCWSTSLTKMRRSRRRSCAISNGLQRV
jgi:hypothetical protein